MSESSYDDLSDIEYLSDSSGGSDHEGSTESDFSLISDPALRVLSRSISSVSSQSTTGSELAEEVGQLNLESGQEESSSSDLAEEVAHLNLDQEQEAKEVVEGLSSVSDEKKEVEEKVEGLLTKAVKVFEEIEKKNEEKKGTEIEKNLKRLSQSSSDYEEHDYIKKLRHAFEKSTISTTIQSQIEGSWRLSSCQSLKLFQIKMRQAGGDILEEMLFESGEPNFEFEGDVLSMSVKFNGKHYYPSTSTLGRPSEAFGYTRISYIEDEKLHTVDKKSSTGLVMNKEERFIEDGKLHIVVNRFGMECVRIYERIM